MTAASWSLSAFLCWLFNVNVNSVCVSTCRVHDETDRRTRGSKRHDGRLLRPHADCPEPGEVKGQHALGSRQLGRLVPPMDLAGIMIAT